MNMQKLKTLQENRLEGETINEASKRLETALPTEVLEKNEVTTETALHQNPIEDDNDFSEEDLVISKWKIVQPTSRVDNAQEGHFYNIFTGEELEKLEDITFLIQKKGRVLFPKDDFSGNRLCWSNTGISPAVDEIIALNNHDPKCDLCVSKTGNKKVIHCKHASWLNEKGEPDAKGKIPPRCKETLSFIGVDATLVPFILNFHGMGIVSVKNFMRNIFIKRQQATVQGKRLGLRNFTFTLSLELQKNQRGKFYTPKFSDIHEIKDVERQKIIYGYYSDLQAFEKKNLEF